MRKNCMPVFQYCADVLKDEPLFSDNESDSKSNGNDSSELSKDLPFGNPPPPYDVDQQHRKDGTVSLFMLYSWLGVPY